MAIDFIIPTSLAQASVITLVLVTSPTLFLVELEKLLIHHFESRRHAFV